LSSSLPSTDTLGGDSFEQCLRAGAHALHLDLQEDQLKQLVAYVALLSKWNVAYNLTAIRDSQQILTHHLLDCLAIAPAFTQARQLLDVGSGAGLPGMVLAIWAKKAVPAMHISMIDTVHKKTAFLTQVKAELGLNNVTIHTGRIEQLSVTRPFDTITSRAFAELRDFIQGAGHVLEEGGRFIAMKGALPHDEMSRLPSGWKVTQTQAVHVPGLDAKRHLIFIEKAAE